MKTMRVAGPLPSSSESDQKAIATRVPACMCVCVCVCEREGERESERGGNGAKRALKNRFDSCRVVEDERRL
jgi:hypothetical protein